MNAYERKHDALQRLLSTNGQFTYLVLNATMFSASTRALLLVLAATLTSKELRYFLDKFYSIHTQCKDQSNFIALCIALKTINDISNDALLLAEKNQPKYALEEYLGGSEVSELREVQAGSKAESFSAKTVATSSARTVVASKVAAVSPSITIGPAGVFDVSYWREYAQKVIFDAIPDVCIVTMNTTELLALIATERKDSRWRYLPGFKLTHSQRDEAELNNFSGTINSNNTCNVDNSSNSNVPNKSNKNLTRIEIVKLKEYLANAINENLHTFLDSTILSDGMRLYLLEQAAIVDDKKFRELLDYVYQSDGSKLLTQLLAIKQINALCWNGIVLENNSTDFNTLEQKALAIYLQEISAAEEAELLQVTKQYVLQVIAMIVKQLAPEKLQTELMHSNLHISMQLPDPSWRVKREFKLTLPQILEAPLLNIKEDQERYKIELIRYEILKAMQHNNFVAAKIAAGAVLSSTNITSIITPTITPETLEQEAEVICTAYRTCIQCDLEQASSIQAVVVAMVELLMLKDEHKSLTELLIGAYDLVSYSLTTSKAGKEAGKKADKKSKPSSSGLLNFSWRNRTPT